MMPFRVCNTHLHSLVSLLDRVVTFDGESSAFDNNPLHFTRVRGSVQFRALDNPHVQGNGRVVGQERRHVQVVVEGVAGRPRVAGEERCGTYISMYGVIPGTLKYANQSINIILTVVVAKEPYQVVPKKSRR